MGYTDLQLVLMETLAYAFGTDGILTAKVMSVVAALVILALTYLLAHEVDSRLRALAIRAAHYEIAQRLSQATTPNTMVALIDVGLIGFVTQRPILDTFGLVNREVAALMHADGGFPRPIPPPSASLSIPWLTNQKS